MLKNIATITAALASLTLFASTTIAGMLVTRSSLLGFEVLGPRVAVLELEDAAVILARAAELADERAVTKAPEGRPADLLVEAVPSPKRLATARTGPMAKVKKGASDEAPPSVKPRR
jgi:hypothetical protein